MRPERLSVVCGSTFSVGLLLLAGCAAHKPAYTVSAAEAPTAPSAPTAQPAAVALAATAAQPANPTTPTPPATPAPLGPPDTAAEAPFMANARQLTFADKFVRAGEAYFDHNTPPQWVIFQAVPRPVEGQTPDPNYSMYVAKLKRDAHGAVTGLDEPIRVSEPGASSTCGWFHPMVPGMILFGTTVTPPAETEPAGYSRDRQRYAWSFPVEMRVVTDVVKPIVMEALSDDRLDASVDRVKTFLNESQPGAPEPVEAESALALLKGTVRDGAKNRTELDRPAGPGYAAECSISPDGRSVLFAYMDPEKKDVDIWVFDVRFDLEPRFTPLVQAKGYDGGAFFSPDGQSICYRSDREGNGELQLFTAQLTFYKKDSKKITGIKDERQITREPGVVNWAPYWSRDGRYLVYASSAQGHQNYELYAVRVDDPSQRARITHAPGFDGLPAFSDDGKLLMWTSQRAGLAPGETRPSSQLWIADVSGEPVWTR